MGLSIKNYIELRKNKDTILKLINKINPINLDNLCLLDQTSLDIYQKDFIISSKNFKLLLIPKMEILKRLEYYNILTIPFNEDSLYILNYIKYVGKIFIINENKNNLDLYFRIYPYNDISCLYVELIDKKNIINDEYIHIDNLIQICQNEISKLNELRHRKNNCKCKDFFLYNLHYTLFLILFLSNFYFFYNIFIYKFSVYYIIWNRN